MLPGKQWTMLTYARDVSSFGKRMYVRGPTPRFCWSQSNERRSNRRFAGITSPCISVWWGARTRTSWTVTHSFVGGARRLASASTSSAIFTISGVMSVRTFRLRSRAGRNRVLATTGPAADRAGRPR